jgi:ubiquinone/menaquinone biosynthesis C-methylase UbiE
VLSLDRQNRYRERYRAMRSGWRTSGEVYESFVRRHIRAGAAALDLGCGAGGVMELFSGQVKLSAGIDPHLPSLRQSRDANLKRVNGDAGILPFAAESFDLVACSWVLEHVTEPAQIFSEISRVLKVGGHFVFLTPNAANYVTRINRLVPRLAQGRLVRALYGRKEDDTFKVAYQANTLESLRALAKGAGFAISEWQTVHDPTYLAFNDLAFRISAAIESRVDEARAVHIVGDLQRRTGT